jgi:hypothetical protein
MSSEEYKISIEGFEVGLQVYVESFVGQVIAMGYSEDEIVAIDFEEEEMIAYMSDGEIIKITKALFITSNKMAKA